MNLQMLKKQDVQQLMQISERTLDYAVKRGDFPKPVKIGRLVRWRQIDIESWVQKQKGQRRSGSL
jgi:prophage regulatory protein